MCLRSPLAESTPGLDLRGVSEWQIPRVMNTASDPINSPTAPIASQFISSPQLRIVQCGTVAAHTRPRS